MHDELKKKKTYYGTEVVKIKIKITFFLSDIYHINLSY